MFTIVNALSALLMRHRLFLAVILLLTNCVVAAAQIRSVTDGYTPLGLAPGAPVGSYELSGFENVNPYNGGLNFSVPIKQMSGRGGASYTMQVPVERKWRVETDDFCDPQTGQCWHFETPIYDGWNFFTFLGPGELMGRRAGYGIQTQNIGCHYYQDTYFKTITRLTFTVPGGTEFELRDQLLSGQPATVAYCAPGPPSRGTVFVTADGTSATFVSDTTIYDEPTPGWEPIIYPSGFLVLKDGTRYRIDDGRVSWIRDRNGNKLIFTPTSNGFTVTDSLNRQITVERVTDVAPYGPCDRITFKGFGGANRVLRVSRTNLGSALRAGYVLQSPHALWPELNNASPYGFHDPEVISRIWLPDGRSYKFKYNSYGELARAELPTGGAIEYDWAPGVNGSSGGGAYCTSSYAVFAYRRVIERRAYPDGASGGAYESKMTFSRPESVSGSGTFSNVGYVNVKEFNSSGTLLTSARHYFFGSPTGSFINSAYDPTSYPSWKESKEWQTEMLATDDTTVLRRVGTTWQQRAAVSWWTGSADGAPPNDPRIADTTTTLVDTNQVSKQTFSYDDTVPFNNRSDVYEYDFGSGTPGSLVRRTHTDYLKTNPVNSIDYTTTSVHIRSLPTQTQVFDAAGIERARTTFEYDNYASSGNNAPLEPRSNISGLDSGFTTSYVTRGNVTRTTGWILSSGTQLHSYNQYDVAGNIVKTIDARGYATTFEFADRYGAPDTEAQGNTAPSELVGLTSYAFATRITDPAGHIAYAQYDYYLGRVVNGEDANGLVASGSYNDSLDRPTQIKRGISTADENQTTFAYDDVARIITTSSDRDAINDNILVSKILYDEMGRTIEQRQYEGGDNYIVTETQYDALGRPHKTSNPYRRWQSETAVWTTQAFDALGRVTSVTTPDSAVVSTSYNGNSVTVTDPAGKARKSVTDALGRLIEIYEDPNGVNYQTTYNYDVLDNLVKVTQGSQQRFFMYDSLKRLIRSRNPEQSTYSSLNFSDPITGNSAWSIGYQYDANSNLTEKTDARGVVTTYEYDALNRNTIINHSDTTINPDVKRFYDGATNGKGRFWHFYSGGDYSNGPNVDHTSIDSYDALGRPLVQRQLFKLNNVWSATYQTSRAYNRAGGVTSQTYPSGHTVSYSYDSAGRTAGFTGNLGDGSNRTYASNIDYSPFGGLKREQFGTTTSLYHKSFYNIRGQLFDTRLSSVNDTWDWNRGRLILYYSSNHLWGQSGTDNNGNVRFAETWIPPENATLDQTDTLIEDSYSYDALNRLTSVAEQRISVANGWVWQQQFRQAYDYDRYGNRTIITDPAQTWGIGINNKHFTVDTATNRLTVPTGQSGVMTYDNAGNLVTDTYTGAGNREYDAENRMTRAWGGNNQWQYYTYNADGQRVRRKVDNQETWQIYGFDGELLAEYAANGPAASPQKEYGYRNGQLLVQTGGETVWSDDAVPLGAAIAGDGESWNWVSSNPGPSSGSAAHQSNIVSGLHQHYFYGATATLSVNAGDKLVAYVYLDPSNMPSQIMLQWGDTNWEHRAYWGANNLPWGVDGTDSRRYMGPLPAAGTWVKLEVPASLVGLEGHTVHAMAFTLWGGRATWDRAGKKSAVQWLLADHLGTPRMIIDQAGTLAHMKRHDYLPFGEELFAGTGGRTTTQGYGGGDGVRQQFTSKERDVETGLDYFLARYYSSTQGRFTSPDEFTGGPDELYSFADEASENPTFYAELSNPQSLNKYQYTYNNPLNLVDPDGHCPVCGRADPQGPRRMVDSLLSLGSKVLDVVQTGVSAVGLVPGAGEGADLANAAISTARGNYAEAAVDLGGALGPVGSGVALGNRLRKLGKGASQADNLVDTAKAGGHTANVRVLEEGRTISKSREVSGNMTPQQKKMGYPKGQLASHTEAKAVRNTQLKQGQTMVITGTKRPCPACKGQMNKAARQTGARIRYQWRQNGRTQRWNASRDPQ